MNKQGWIHFATFFVGFWVVLAGLFVGFAAVEYETTHQASSEGAAAVSDGIDSYGVIEYEELSADEQAVVDATLEGERYRFADDDELATRWGSGRVVSQGDQYHVVTRGTVVDWGSPQGLAALALVGGGLLLIVESIRRHHFPQYRPLAGLR